jgi:hypothetical protein
MMEGSRKPEETGTGTDKWRGTAVVVKACYRL